MCIELTNFRHCNFATGRSHKGRHCLRVQRIPHENVVFDVSKPVEFPLKPMADKANRTLEGLMAGHADDEDSFLGWDGKSWRARWLGQNDAPGIMHVDKQGNPVLPPDQGGSGDSGAPLGAHSSADGGGAGDTYSQRAPLDERLLGLRTWVREDLHTRSLVLSNMSGPPIASVRYRSVVDMDTGESLETLQDLREMPHEQRFSQLTRAHNLRTILYYDPSDGSFQDLVGDDLQHPQPARAVLRVEVDLLPGLL